MNRNYGIDAFRVMCAFTVVVIHSAMEDILYRDAVMHYLPPANACFAFLAGWFLFNPSAKALSLRDVGGLLVKRLKRLVIPYLVWEGIYVMANIGFDLMAGKFNPPVGTDWIGILFLGSGSVQLWFVITLVYVQITLCGVMSIMLASRGVSFFRGLPMAGFFVMLAIGALLWRMNGIENDYLRRFVFLSGYGALGVGLRCAVQEMSCFEKTLIRTSMVCIGGGLVATSWIFNIPEVVRVLSWCLIFGCMPINAVYQEWLTYGSGAVMGVYLCHVLFTRMIAMGLPVITRVIPNGYMVVLINALIGFTASLVFVLVMKRTRCRWIVCFNIG